MKSTCSSLSQSVLVFVHPLSECEKYMLKPIPSVLVFVHPITKGVRENTNYVHISNYCTYCSVAEKLYFFTTTVTSKHVKEEWWSSGQCPCLWTACPWIESRPKAMHPTRLQIVLKILYNKVLTIHRTLWVLRKERKKDPSTWCKHITPFGS